MENIVIKKLLVSLDNTLDYLHKEVPGLALFFHVPSLEPLNRGLLTLTRRIIIEETLMRKLLPSYRM